MENELIKECPYCGQMWELTSPEERPEMLCRCPGALLEQGREENTKILLESVKMLFGEECTEVEPSFRPVEEEVFSILCELTNLVGREEIGTVSFGLSDGTSGKISVKGIERKKNITRKLGK